MQTKIDPRAGWLTRRHLLGGLALGASGLVTTSSRATDVVGKASAIRGRVDRRQDTLVEGLKPGADILDQDNVKTGVASFADLELGSDTRILLGPETELFIDTFIAGQGGTLELGTGQMVFDRPEGLPKIDLALRTAFGQIGVRGTKFFAGPNRGAFAVFVEHGEVAVTGGGVTKLVGAGEGVQISRPGAAPDTVVKWGAARIKEVYRRVGLE